MIITMQTAVAAWAIQKGPEMPAWLDICWGSTLEREKREKKILVYSASIGLWGRVLVGVISQVENGC